MTQAQTMLDTFPGTFGFDRQELADAIDALTGCAMTCMQCADACLSEPSVADMAACIRLDLDCADICGATARVIGRQTAYDAGVTRAMLEACIAVCTACAAECGQHGQHMEHCRMCAEECRRCEQACRTLLAGVGA